MTDQTLTELGLDIVCDNAYALATHDKEAFVKLRRCGLGASDSSIYLGVNIYHTVDSLIEQKLSDEITQEEIEIGQKENVRKGADLEPLILNKFEEWYGWKAYKPNAMYRISRYPQLTVNFDGIVQLTADIFIPVEAKFVSKYADKYWNKSKSMATPASGVMHSCGGSGTADHIKLAAELYGIPPYYYTQVQQQLLALNADFGYLVALFDKGWDMRVFKIFKDPYTQQELIKESSRIWNTIEKKRSN